MREIEDHPLRYKLASELHARPFPALRAPAAGAFVALKHRGDAGEGREAATDHLIALLDRLGTAHPAPGATHHSVEIGRHFVKWECHSEFVTYTVIEAGREGAAFDPSVLDVLPQDWLARAPGPRITSALLSLEIREGQDTLLAALAERFVPESLAVSEVLDGSAVIASDFRIDGAGHVRISLFLDAGCGARRTGRIVQRLTEIETYKAMSMIGLYRARSLTADMERIEAALGRITDTMAAGDRGPDRILADLLPLAAELENLVAASSYRFGATAAYAAIVAERVRVLREERVAHRQTFHEFMTRRYDPAMRTVVATQRRLSEMSSRALRVSDLLRTRVDVERSAQNQALLASMDRRAEAQLQLQKTVEGLSIVAISYYAVNLAAYLLAPAAEAAGVGKTALLAGLVPLVVLLVWMMVRRVRRALD